MTNETFFPWWEQHCDRFKAILFDIDGTILAGHRALPGALEIIDWLRTRHYPFYLLTNDGNHSTQEKSQLLAKAGFAIDPSEIVSCSMALNLLTEEHDLYGKLFFVMGDLGIPNYAELAGLTITRNFGDLDTCQGIIVGEGYYDWHDNINAVLNSLRKNPDRWFIVPNPDSYWPNGPDGDIGVGAGGKARFIHNLLKEMGYHVNITYLGKPYSLIYQYTIELLVRKFDLDHDIDLTQILMLGDSLKSDIAGANQCGLTSGLMLTGITEEHQIKKSGMPELEIPDYIFKSIL